MRFHRNRLLLASSFAVGLVAILGLPSHAHNGGILVQAIDGKLVTGFDNASSGNQTIGDRAFSLLFPSSLANDVPSFSSLANAPAGSEPLPVGGQLFWDFLPMTHQGITSNLLYWDGLGTSTSDVEFGAVPGGDTTLTLYTQGFFDNAFVDGSANMTPGKQIGTVSNDNLALHAHRWFFLDSATTPPEGVYLFAMQLRMAGYENSDPFYIAAATDDISANTLDFIALPWVENNVDTLIVDGDYDLDGDVDGGDFLVWQRQYGSTGPFPSNGTYADGNRDGIVDAEDLDVWKESYSPASTLAAISSQVPEPSSAITLLLALGIIGAKKRVRIMQS